MGEKETRRSCRKGREEEGGNEKRRKDREIGKGDGRKEGGK